MNLPQNPAPDSAGDQSDLQFNPGPAPEDAWDLLSPFLSANRRQRLLAAAAGRTRFVRLVVQDVHQPHNISACLRSAEAFGLAEVDIVNHKQKFKPSTVAKGVGGWLNLQRYESVAECVARLKSAGFRIAAGFPAQDGIPLTALPVDQPLAVVFGNEHAGVAPEWLPAIDLRFTIPMAGLVESLNISVSAAITLYELTTRARATVPQQYHLRDAERRALLNHWICRQTPSWQKQLAVLRAGKTTP